jgi:CMP-N-acetylneuraminic acid synthetase
MLERAEATQRSWFQSYRQNSKLYLKQVSTWEQEYGFFQSNFAPSSVAPYLCS